MSYDNLRSVSQNVLKFYHQLTGEERRVPFIFDDFHFCRFRVFGLDLTENRIFVKIVKNERDPALFTSKLVIKFQNILRNTTQVIIRHRVKILFSVISSPITLEWQKLKSSKMKGILLSSPVNS
jgi:two-component sensor histidine kinase